MAFKLCISVQGDIEEEKSNIAVIAEGSFNDVVPKIFPFPP